MIHGPVALVVENETTNITWGKILSARIVQPGKVKAGDGLFTHPRVSAFGRGDKIVRLGTYGDAPAVFVQPADHPGVPGELVPKDQQTPGNYLSPGEYVMTFPTEDQALAVANSICGSKLPENKELTLKNRYRDIEDKRIGELTADGLELAIEKWIRDQVESFPEQHRHHCEVLLRQIDKLLNIE